MGSQPSLAVFKFASCDGCQLSLLDAEDELLTLAGKVRIAHFIEASSHVEPGPYDIALVEGSITTPHDQQRIREVRLTIPGDDRGLRHGRRHSGSAKLARHTRVHAVRLCQARVHRDAQPLDRHRGPRAGRF